MGAKLIPVRDDEGGVLGVTPIDPSQVVYQGNRARLIPTDDRNIDYEKLIYSPTAGIPAPQLALEGVGQGLTEIGRGVNQIRGRMTPAEYDKARQLDKPLTSTTPGMLGGILGQSLPFLPLSGTGIMQAGAIGGLQGFSTPTGTGDSRLLNTALGVPLGSIGQMGANVLHRTVAGPSRDITPAKAALAKEAKKLGYDLSPGQITDNPTLKQVEGAFSDLPLTGKIERERAMRNQAITTGIGAESMGTPGKQVTPDVVKEALDTAGQTIGDLARNTPQVTLGRDFVRDIMKARNELDMLPNTIPGKAPAIKFLDEMRIKALRGAISGEEQQITRSVLTSMYKSGLNDPRTVPVARAQRAVRNALDNAMYASVSPDQQAALKTARSNYANAKTIQGTDPIGGDLSALKIPQDVQGTGSPLEPVREIGRAFKTDIPQSGTNPRFQAVNALKHPWVMAGGMATGGAAAGGAYGGPEGALGGGAGGFAAGLLGPRAMQSLYYSPIARYYLTHGMLGANPALEGVLSAGLQTAEKGTVPAGLDYWNH